MTDKYKVRVSTFVADILENDALRFGFLKNGKSNKNALLNKLIPVLLATRKERRSKIEEILRNEYARKDSVTYKSRPLSARRQCRGKSRFEKKKKSACRCTRGIDRSRLS